MAMAGLGLEDPEILAEAVRGIFWDRCNYEDNAQWYLIISALVARGGYHIDQTLCRRSLEFLRDNESHGAFIPPRAPGNTKEPLGWKSYMDLFYYADGDSPTSNQGFHCGALRAGQELGVGVSDGDIGRACRAYAAMFHRAGGYFPTSAMRPEIFGGDALYGEAVTFAAFGKKSLPDDLVLRHCRHAMKIQSPYGIRVVSKADGELLDADQYGPNNPHGLPPERAGARTGRRLRPGRFVVLLRCRDLAIRVGSRHGSRTGGRPPDPADKGRTRPHAGVQRIDPHAHRPATREYSVQREFAVCLAALRDSPAPAAYRARPGRNCGRCVSCDPPGGAIACAGIERVARRLCFRSSFSPAITLG